MSKQRIPRTKSGTILKAVDPETRDAVVDLEVALSQAWAARTLLGVEADSLHMPVDLPPGYREENMRGWFRNFAFAALDEALKDMETARKKIWGPRVFGSARKAVA